MKMGWIVAVALTFSGCLGGIQKKQAPAISTNPISVIQQQVNQVKGIRTSFSNVNFFNPLEVSASNCAGEIARAYYPFQLDAQAAPVSLPIKSPTPIPTTYMPNWITSVGFDETTSVSINPTPNSNQCSYASSSAPPPVSLCSTLDYQPFQGLGNANGFHHLKINHDECSTALAGPLRSGVHAAGIYVGLDRSEILEENILLSLTYVNAGIPMGTNALVFVQLLSSKFGDDLANSLQPRHEKFGNRLEYPVVATIASLDTGPYGPYEDKILVPTERFREADIIRVDRIIGTQGSTHILGMQLHRLGRRENR